jgi:hypothetical protein
MELTTFLILCVILVILMSISLMIEEIKYRLAYYLVCALGFLVIMNIYLGITYYISLRNDPGVQGPQGDKGPQGASGQPGNCSYSAECGIKNARTLILDTANKMYGIDTGCLDTPNLTTCGSQSTLDLATPINSQINMLEQIAYSTSMSQSDFTSKLSVCLQDPENCNEDTEF